MEGDFHRNCCIGFSNDSEYFAALDLHEGLNILRITDGQQFHCCAPKNGIDPATFFFDCNGDSISVICTDHNVRRFSLKTGVESLEDTQTLPSVARFNGDAGIQFAVNSDTGALACCRDDQLLQLFVRNDIATGWKNPKSIAYLEDTCVCRLEFSRDRKWLGVGCRPVYGTPVQRDDGAIWKYELINVESGTILKRIATHQYKETREFTSAIPAIERIDGGIVTFEVASKFAACLNAAGNDICIAVPSEAP